MSIELLKRADALRAEYRMKEGVRGSGFHDDDRNPTRTDLYTAPQRNGRIRCSEQLVAFFDFEYEFVEFVGPDAERLGALLAGWIAKNRGGDPSNKPGTHRALLFRIIPRLTPDSVGGLARISVPLNQWNDVLSAIHAEGQDVLGLPIDG